MVHRLTLKAPCAARTPAPTDPGMHFWQCCEQLPEPCASQAGNSRRTFPSCNISGTHAGAAPSAAAYPSARVCPCRAIQCGSILAPFPPHATRLHLGKGTGEEWPRYLCWWMSPPCSSSRPRAALPWRAPTRFAVCSRVCAALTLKSGLVHGKGCLCSPRGRGMPREWDRRGGDFLWQTHGSGVCTAEGRAAGREAGHGSQPPAP